MKNAPSSFQTINPTTLEIIKTHSHLDSAHVEKKMEQAHQSWLHWKWSSIRERRSLLLGIAQNLLENKNALARQMALEMGKPLRDGDAEIAKSAETCQYYAAHLEEFLAGEEVKAHYKESRVSIESLGVLFCVMPWNFPIWQVTRFAVPALALGNTILLKHSDIVAGTAELLVEIFQTEVNRDPLFFHCPVDHKTAAKIIADPRVKAVSFTGSTRGGREIGRQAGEHLKKSVLELGGSDAYILFEDADFDNAIKTCVQARMVNNGQSCIAAKRFFVPEKNLNDFIEGIQKAINDFDIGDPLQEKTQVGPLAQIKFKEDLIQSLKDLVPHSRQQLQLRDVETRLGRGAFFNPQLMVFDLSVREAHEIELFGPVFSVFPYKNLEAALKAINSSPFGLGAAIFSQDISQARQWARKLECGMVAINTMVRSDPRLPFGGVKESGYGRELGRWGFYEFAHIKTVGVG